MRNEASWIKDWRKEALQLYETIKEPSIKDELYRYIPLSSLRCSLWDRKEAREESLKKAKQQEGLLLGEEAVLYLNGATEEMDCASPLPKGLTFSSIGKALEEKEALLRPYWKGPDLWAKDKFAQQSYGKFQEGFFLHVGENIKLKGSLRVSNTLKDCFYRNLVILEKGASLSLVEEYLQENKGGNFHSGVTEFYVKEGACFTNVYLQEFSEGTNYSSRKYMELEKEASVEYVDLAWGGAKGQERLEVALLGEKAKITATVACRLDSDQHFAFVGNIRHCAPYTLSELYSHSIVADNAKATLNATVQVNSQALHAQSEQRNRGLLLSKKANVHSMPKLLIATDEVTCTHGSSISHIEEDVLYYLESRGIARKDAIKIVVNGLIEPILRKVPLGVRREWIASRLDKKSWGELA